MGFSLNVRLHFTIGQEKVSISKKNEMGEMQEFHCASRGFCPLRISEQSYSLNSDKAIYYNVTSLNPSRPSHFTH